MEYFSDFSKKSYHLAKIYSLIQAKFELRVKAIAAVISKVIEGRVVIPPPPPLVLYLRNPRNSNSDNIKKYNGSRSILIVVEKVISF